MSDMTISSGYPQLLAALPAEIKGTSSECLVIEIGQAAFATTDTACELALTYLETVEFSTFGWLGATAGTLADGVPQSDNVVTSGAITVCRTAGADSAADFQYLLIGRGKHTAA